MAKNCAKEVDRPMSHFPLYPLRLQVRFASDDYGRSLGRLRDLLKAKAMLAGLAIRKRPNGVEIAGPRVESALVLLMAHGFDVASFGAGTSSHQHFTTSARYGGD